MDQRDHLIPGEWPLIHLATPEPDLGTEDGLA